MPEVLSAEYFSHHHVPFPGFQENRVGQEVQTQALKSETSFELVGKIKKTTLEEFHSSCSSGT